jgi:hypothetical protein
MSTSDQEPKMASTGEINFDDGGKMLIPQPVKFEEWPPRGGEEDYRPYPLRPQGSNVEDQGELQSLPVRPASEPWHYSDRSGGFPWSVLLVCGGLFLFWCGLVVYVIIRWKQLQP